LLKCRENFDDVTPQGTPGVDTRTRPQAREHTVEYEASLESKITALGAVQQVSLDSAEPVTLQYVTDIIKEASELDTIQLWITAQLVQQFFYRVCWDSPGRLSGGIHLLPRFAMFFRHGHPP